MNMRMSLREAPATVPETAHGTMDRTVPATVLREHPETAPATARMTKDRAESICCRKGRVPGVCLDTALLLYQGSFTACFLLKKFCIAYTKKEKGQVEPCFLSFPSMNWNG